MTNNKMTAPGYIMIADTTLGAMLAFKANGTERVICEDAIPANDYALPGISYQLINGGISHPIIDQEQFYIRIHAELSVDIMNIKNRVRILFDDTVIAYNGINYKSIIDTGVNTVSENVNTYVLTLTLKQLKGV